MLRRKKAGDSAGGKQRKPRRARQATNPGPVETDPIRAVLASEPVTERTPLRPGDAVQVEWGGNWWAGEVVQLEDDGRVKIHYSGWDDNWDEVVPRTRLCLKATEPKTLSVMLDNGQTLTGGLITSAGEFLVLTRDNGAVKTFVNKAKVLYVDVGSR